LNTKTGKFTWFTTALGLADNNISNVLIDKENIIWVSHHGGISSINPVSRKIENFTTAEGLAWYFTEENTEENSALAMHDGALIFAGAALNRIWPAKMQKDTFNPDIMITSFKLHNKDVLIKGPDSILRQSIFVTKSLKLKHEQNVISFQFAALDMVQAKYRTYAYQLEGFDTGWQYVGNKREVTFTNMGPGTYF
jgi:hypothetical protein